jgi:subtilisin family serine protease
MSKPFNWIAVGLPLLLIVVSAPSLVAAAPAGSASAEQERLIVVARSDAVYDQLRLAAQQAGASIVKDMRESGMLVVRGTAAAKAQIQATGLSKAVAKDHIEKLVPNDSARADLTNSSGSHVRTALAPDASQAVARERSVRADPAFALPGLMWSIDRIRAPEAWRATTGSPRVMVGVADTGLDFTHAELGPQVARVVDFTTTEDPPICKTFFPNPINGDPTGIGDEDLAAQLGGPETTDWNGHGSWIGGNIAAALDGEGINGIAPDVKLVSLKISQWCGSAYDSTIMDAFTYAGANHIDIVNISFGGYLDLSDPDQMAIWAMYNEVVHKVRAQGTLIVAATGNEHTRVGAAGLVLSHGTLTVPGTAPKDFRDEFGHFEVPGGVPGVIDVSSTANVVVPPSAVCPAGTADGSNAVCKPTSDRHQASGQGLQNQLAYYSNYGPRIDVAGPGGARKFNVPAADRGGTPGFPVTTADGFTAFEAFSTTSNWAVQIPCFTLTLPGFRADQCYSTIQGTSMATPHVSAAAALIASTNASARGNPALLQRLLKSSARHLTGNQTRVLDPQDRSKGDLSGGPCVTGYCHLGGEAVSDAEAYGAGLVDAARAVGR